MRITKDPGGRMTKHLLRHPRVWIRVFTQRKHLFLAEETVAAGNRKRHDDAVANIQVGHFSPHLDYFAHEFMTEDIAALHRRNKTVVEVQIRSADRG